MMDNSTISVPGLASTVPDAVFYDLAGTVIFPYSLAPFAVEGENNRAALREAMRSDRLLAIFPEMPDPAELQLLPGKAELSVFEKDGTSRLALGVLVRVLKELNLPDGSVRVVVRGVKRITFQGFAPARKADDVLRVRYSVFEEKTQENKSTEILAFCKSLQMAFQG